MLRTLDPQLSTHNSQLLYRLGFGNNVHQVAVRAMSQSVITYK